MKLKKKDLEIIKVLEDDARATLNKIKKATGIPVSTAHDRIKRMLEDGIIKPSITVDYTKLEEANDKANKS